ncbi:hypothetical protein SAMN04487848_3192 [Microbacterium sp. ru370.1]|uniref:hypothetical protein n=1 Tax=unclassified Microbacterium TaxID=2609290 RepID=UPI0008805B82|nr:MULTISPECIES: hypothetical protein [unclassified Microbacterium]PTT16884.1 hypothetical protein DBR36_11975 [Microbacterium sp. HMWF026]SDP07996.1 hypothetical protein SAMN04487848_3192 [Microbacterium sp. ru370.1]
MSNDGTANNNPFNRWWIVSALFVVAVAVAIVLVLVLGRGGQNDAAQPGAEPSDTSGASQPSTTSAPPTSGGACDVNTADQDIPTAGPPAEWESERYFFYPTSTEYGPVVSDGPWGCFAPSPTGALFAAANAVAGIARENFGEVVTANAVDNGGGEQYIANTRGQTRDQIAGRVAQIRGFTFTAVQPERVTVQLILGQNDTEASFTVSMAWDEQQTTWLVDYAASSFTPTEYTGARYTPWSANE